MKRRLNKPPQREKVECPWCPRWCWVTEEALLKEHLIKDHPDHPTDTPEVQPAPPKPAGSSLTPPEKPMSVQAPLSPVLNVSNVSNGSSNRHVFNTSVGPLEVSIAWITPADALQMLEANVDNRSVREQHVRTLTKALNSVQWLMTGESLKYDINDRLVDGQHRLLACTRAGVPFETFVIRGLPVEARKAVDTGAKRRLFDALKWQGEVNLPSLAAAVVLGWRWDNGNPTSNEMPSTQTALDWLNEHPTARPAVRMVHGVCRKPLRLSPAGGGAVLARALMIDEDSAEMFVAAIASDSDHQQGDAVLALRRWTQRVSDDRSSLRGWVYAAFMVKAWNAWLSGAEVQNLTFRSRGGKPESFPAMIDLEGIPYPFPDVIEERRRKAEANRIEREAARRKK